MTNVLILLLAQAAAAAPATAPMPDGDAVKAEIAAVGERMETWEGGFYKREGEPTCRITKSTGDMAIDAIRCGALISCVTPLSAKMESVWNSDLPEVDRQQGVREIMATAKPCIDAYHVAGVVKLARARVAAK